MRKSANPSGKTAKDQAFSFLFNQVTLQQRQENHVFFLPLLSVLFIVTAMIQPHAGTLYYPLVLSGLVLCLIEDVCLI